VKNLKILCADRLCVWMAILCCLFPGFKSQMVAQNVTPAAQGEKAAWSNSSAIVGSLAVIDASAFCTSAVQGPCSGSANNPIDFCVVVQYALKNLPKVVVSSPGVVLDARGIVPLDGGKEPCSIDPFNEVTYSGSITVLLPASTLQMTHEWLLPSNTRLIGEGPQTILQAQSIFTVYDSSNAMIEMGSSTICPAGGCTGISIEHLRLDGSQIANNTLGLNGIYNAYAQDASYVDDIALQTFGAVPGQNTTTTGLFIGPGAANSGPYSNIYFLAAAHCQSNQSCNNNGNCACGPTACVKIQAPTRGLHSITCIANSVPPGESPTLPAAAIYLDASNNTIEDVHVEGFYDAAVVGDNAGGPVAGNTLANILGGFGAGPVQNAVHICKPSITYGGTNYSACVSNNSATIQDISILNAKSIGAPRISFAATTIQDDLTGATVNSSAYPAFVGKYVVGEPVSNGNNTIGYSRFTTSPAGALGTTVPTWAVGGSAAGRGASYL
jgi:hypothetical protein